MFEYSWNRLKANQFYIELDKIWNQKVAGSPDRDDKKFLQDGKKMIEALVKELPSNESKAQEIRNRVAQLLNFFSDFKLHALTITSFNRIIKRAGTYVWPARLRFGS